MTGLSDVQRELRRGRVTGSWAACAMGEDPERTAADLWRLLRDGRDLAIPAAAARGGLALEGPTARLAEAEYGWRLRRTGRTYIAGDLAASPDYWRLGTRDLVETKVWAGSLDVLPRRWYWQAIAQLATRPTTASVWIVALTGARLRRFQIQRASVAEDLERLSARATEVVAAVGRGDPPPLDERDDASDVLTFATLLPGQQVAIGEAADAGDDLARLVTARKAIEADEVRVRRHLADLMAANGSAGLVGTGWQADARAKASGVSLVFTVTGTENGGSATE